MENVYQEHGYNDRKHYLSSLAEDYGVNKAPYSLWRHYLAKMKISTALCQCCKTWKVKTKNKNRNCRIRGSMLELSSPALMR